MSEGFDQSDNEEDGTGYPWDEECIYCGEPLNNLGVCTSCGHNSLLDDD